MVPSIFHVASVLLVAQAVVAHIELVFPPGINSKFDPQTPQNKIDYSMTTPMNGDGSNYPCKGYNTAANIAALNPVTTLTAGGSIAVTLTGSATHGGGSCEFAVSYDQGATFAVIASVIGGCPIAGAYTVAIPAGLPSAKKALFAWSWFNPIGNFENYMNCAVVDVVGTGSTGYTGPALFRANTWPSSSPYATCLTPRSADFVFPAPGPSVQYGGSRTSADPVANLAALGCPATSYVTLGTSSGSNNSGGSGSGPTFSPTNLVVVSSSSASASAPVSTLAVSICDLPIDGSGGKCGPGTGFRCGAGLCCSSTGGYCGTTPEYCQASSCQIGYGLCTGDNSGSCGAVVTSSVSSTTSSSSANAAASSSSSFADSSTSSASSSSASSLSTSTSTSSSSISSSTSASSSSLINCQLQIDTAGGTCGGSTKFRCSEALCCSGSGYCGQGAAYCTNAQLGFGSNVIGSAGTCSGATAGPVSSSSSSNTTPVVVVVKSSTSAVIVKPSSTAVIVKSIVSKTTTSVKSSATAASNFASGIRCTSLTTFSLCDGVKCTPMGSTAAGTVCVNGKIVAKPAKRWFLSHKRGAGFSEGGH